LLGDAQFGFHGASAIGFMTLQGTKSLKTDLHSVTGSILGVSRDIAKIFNYSRIYGKYFFLLFHIYSYILGAGKAHAIQLLIKHNPGINKLEAEKKVFELFKQTKGLQFREKWKGKFCKSFWLGGSESFMFNAMESIGTSDNPRTPVLHCGIPDALLPTYVGSHFMTSRVNWVVQSSGVDYLHLLLVAMSYLGRRMDIEIRFLLSIHDEVRFLVKEEHAYKAVLALQISNFWVRSLFSERVGMKDLPQVTHFLFFKIKKNQS
jgi:DNA polymerase gamma 1